MITSPEATKMTEILNQGFKSYNPNVKWSVQLHDHVYGQVMVQGHILGVVVFSWIYQCVEEEEEDLTMHDIIKHVSEEFLSWDIFGNSTPSVKLFKHASMGIFRKIDVTPVQETEPAADYLTLMEEIWEEDRKRRALKSKP